MINLWYHESANYGDALSKWLTEKITGQNVQVTPRLCQYPHYVVIGSILSSCTEFSTVWGAGLSYDGEPIGKIGKIHMVRGELSKKAVREVGIECPDFVADPVWTLPLFYNRTISKKHKLGIFPHWVDFEQCREHYGHLKDVFIGNLLCDNPEDIIDQIRSCEQVISSSLHGIVTAHAYGIPVRWVEFSDKVFGNGFKFSDYYSSLGITGIEALNLRKKESLSHILSHISQEQPYCDSGLIMRACPFRTEP